MCGKRRESSEGRQSGGRSGGHVSILVRMGRQAGRVVIAAVGDRGGIIPERVTHDVMRTHSGAGHSLRTEVGAKVDRLGPGLCWTCCPGMVMVLGRDLAIIQRLAHLRGDWGRYVGRQGSLLGLHCVGLKFGRDGRKHCEGLL